MDIRRAVEVRVLGGRRRRYIRHRASGTEWNEENAHDLLLVCWVDLLEGPPGLIFLDDPAWTA
eukprot:4706604-Karenia_brevis.AAC.1